MKQLKFQRSCTLKLYLYPQLFSKKAASFVVCLFYPLNKIQKCKKWIKQLLASNLSNSNILETTLLWTVTFLTGDTEAGVTEMTDGGAGPVI